MPTKMNGSASAPWRRSQRRLQGRSRLISPRSVIVDPRQLGVPWGTVPFIVADASGAFCQLGHRGANKTDAMEPSCDAAPAPSIGTMNSRRFIRSPRPRSAREYRCRDGQPVGSSVRAAATIRPRHRDRDPLVKHRTGLRSPSAGSGPSSRATVAPSRGRSPALTSSTASGHRKRSLNRSIPKLCR
jgi:hypothetical protein